MAGSEDTAFSELVIRHFNSFKTDLKLKLDLQRKSIWFEKVSQMMMKSKFLESIQWIWHLWTQNESWSMEDYSIKSRFLFL